MKNITLHIKDKEYKAQPYELEFGTIRKLMEILKVEDMTNQAQLLKAITEAWDDILEVFRNIFPDVTGEEMDKATVKEVLRVTIEIAKFAVSDIFIIPTEKN